MLSYLVTENAPWLELPLVLTVGTAVMVGLAALADRRVRSAIWQRTIWQVTTLGVLSLVLVELTGTGPALVGLWRARTEAEATQLGAAPIEAIANPLTPGPSPRERGEGRSLLDTQSMADVQPSAAPLEPPVVEDPGLFEEENRLPAEQSAETGWTTAVATDGSSQSGERVAGVERSEPPESPIPGGSLTLDPGHPELGQPPGQAFWWLGLIWALGAVLIAARTVCARALLFAFWRRGTRLSEGPLCERAAGLARRLGIRRRVCVLEAVGLSAPVAFGSLRPAVALPVTFAEEFDRQQQDAVLAHELAHLAARDPAWQVVAGLLCAALWWHPLVWWSRHRLRAASEAAADEASLLVPDGPDALAGCLVAMGRRLARVPSGRRQLGWVSFEGPGFRSSLGRRVERLLSLRRRPWRAPGRGRLAFAKATLPVALLIVAVCCTAWARSQATLTEGGTTMSVLRVSWRHSLAAAMLGFVTAGCTQAMADDPPADQSLPAVAGSDLAGAQVQLALLAEGQDREKGEAREREEGEREKGEAREGKEREHEEGEAREGKERKREKGEAREGKEPKREAREERRPEPRADLEGQLRELRGQVTELRQQIKELREILKGLLARERKEGAAREGEKRERKEGEAREGEKRERKEGETREGEKRERKEGEAREGEKRERKEGEAREGEKRERKEGAAREGEKRERKEGEAREGEKRERKEGDREGKEGKAREDE